MRGLIHQEVSPKCINEESSTERRSYNRQDQSQYWLDIVYMYVCIYIIYIYIYIIYIYIYTDVSGISKTYYRLVTRVILSNWNLWSNNLEQIPNFSKQLNKRNIMKFLASIYDSLWFISLCLLTGKVIYRKVCNLTFQCHNEYRSMIYTEGDIQMRVLTPNSLLYG